MALKVFKAIWFLSLLIFLGVFMYNYAGLPEVVNLVDSIDSPLSLSREALFYSLLAVAAILNVFVFIISKLYSSNPDFKSWFYGLITTLNIFLIIGVNFVTLFNSAEKFDYSRIGNIIYGSLLLVVLWVAAWPIYSLVKKISAKQAV
ncbi:MAG: hypothetical protein HOP30_00520 [Cyclobacteriaceae bacterium]|nr:hypothetical protein [Cyclobacteriaceae bacterium]